MKLETINVDVTQQQIDEGNHLCCCSCPIANSIKRELTPGQHFPKLDDVSVHMEDGWLTHHERDENSRVVRTLYDFKLPPIAKEFILAWEAHDPALAPISFDLTLIFVRVRENIIPSSR